MSDPRILPGQLPERNAFEPTTPDSATNPTTTSEPYPTDFLQLTSRRVVVAGVAFGCLWVVGYVMGHLTESAAATNETVRALNAAWVTFGAQLRLGMSALSFGVAAAAHQLRDRPKLGIGLGLGLEVATAAALAMLERWGYAQPGRGVSWVCLPILMFPSIIPTGTQATLIAAFLSAATVPAAYAVAVATGSWPPTPGIFLMWWFVPPVLCAIMAVIPSHVMASMGRAVKQARQLGNYHLEKLLGVGGMGEVYQASHRLLARPAAVKLVPTAQLGVRDGLGRAMMIERFRREATAAASLRSPHTISLYDFGVGRDGTLYYAMELLDGIDLQEVVEADGAQPPRRVASILRQICLSLAEAHAKGLVHRDVKPSNVMLCRMGTELDFVKVLDFGLVKLERPNTATLTAPDATAGTPAYMAPESIDGTHSVDHRADLYALGCVGYWLLTGRLAFEGPNPLAILFKHRTNPVPPITVAGAEELAPIILACLAKSPDERPSSALEVARALDRLRGMDWTQDDAARWWSGWAGPHRVDREMLSTAG